MNQRTDDSQDAAEQSFESTCAGDDDLSIESFCRALSTPRRLEALVCVLVADEPLSVEALASTIAAKRAVEREERELVLSLFHCDLPLLADAGLVAFDPAADCVAPTMVASVIAHAALELAAELS